MGAEGICFPLVRSVEDARRCVASLRYRPEGTRSFGPFLAHARWRVPLAAYAEGPGRQTVCMILIETAEALERIDEICAVEGIDCLVLAPFDLSTELGVSGRMDHPRMQAAVARIEAAVLAAGIPLGGIGLDEGRTRALLARGYRLIVGVDILRLGSGVAAQIDWLRSAP